MSRWPRDERPVLWREPHSTFSDCPGLPALFGRDRGSSPETRIEPAPAVTCRSAFNRRAVMATGTVKFFNTQKGYGFIRPDDGGQDVFVHITAVEAAGLPGLNEGQKVSYEVASDRGKTKAVNLQAA
jgi:CspA family cold shock protein